MNQTITVGKLVMTTQAFAIAAMGLIICLFVFLKTKSIAIVLPVAIMAVWQAYVANCSVVGRCDAVAWTLVITYALGFFMMLYAYGNPKKLAAMMKK